MGGSWTTANAERGCQIARVASLFASASRALVLLTLTTTRLQEPGNTPHSVASQPDHLLSQSLSQSSGFRNKAPQITSDQSHIPVLGHGSLIRPPLFLLRKLLYTDQVPRLLCMKGGDCVANQLLHSAENHPRARVGQVGSSRSVPGERPARTAR